MCLQGVLSRLQAQLEVGDAALQPVHRHRYHQRQDQERDQDQGRQQQLQAQQPVQQISELGQVNTNNAAQAASSPLCEAAERLTSQDLCDIAEGASRLCRYDAALWQAVVHCASVQDFDSWPLQVSTA